MTNIELLGRVFITGEIYAETGLHIGGSPGALAIGNVDLPVIREAQTGRPIIPASSLKGKLRSLSERFCNAPLNFTVHPGKAGKGEVRIHAAQEKKDYENPKYGWINKVFGTTGDAGDFISAPNRLLVRDIPMLSDESQEPQKGSAQYFDKYIKTDLPFTEVKWEAAIDRVTSAATPRQIERVPAGAVFAPMEMVFSYYLEGDEALLGNLLTAMELLEDDYLGGHGSRGSGKIEFRGLKIYLRKGAAYQEVRDPRFAPENGLTLPQLAALKADLVKWVAEQMKPKEG
jgi:CRISPR-associated protein Csm3